MTVFCIDYNYFFFNGPQIKNLHTPQRCVNSRKVNIAISKADSVAKKLKWQPFFKKYFLKVKTHYEEFIKNKDSFLNFKMISSWKLHISINFVQIF